MIGLLWYNDLIRGMKRPNFEKICLIEENTYMKRKNNYDLLRIISAVAVTVIHVNIWFSSAVYKVSEYGTDIHEIPAAFMLCIYNSVTRFAVPCFIMLSGAFILDNKKNAEYKNFYSKSFAKIGVPTIIFSILYIFYGILKCFIGEEQGTTELQKLLKDLLNGAPMYHMWYIFMLIGIYVLTPVVIRFKESITEKMFYKVSFVFLILASVSHWTTGQAQLSWDIGQSFEYLGYFMTGYSIRKIFAGKNSNSKAFALILAGIILEMCAAGLEYKEMMEGIFEKDLEYEIIAPYCPFIVPASICIFIGFTLLNVKREYADMSEITFYIYLIHAGVWDFMQKVFNFAFGVDFLTDQNGGIWVPVLVIAVFVISCVLSKLYLWIWGKLDKERRITNYLLRIVRLQTD